jgi:hypothetical protein
LLAAKSYKWIFFRNKALLPWIESGVNNNQFKTQQAKLPQQTKTADSRDLSSSRTDHSDPAADTAWQQKTKQDPKDAEQPKGRQETKKNIPKHAHHLAIFYGR